MQSKPQGTVKVIIRHYFEREIGKREENQIVSDQIRIQHINRQRQHRAAPWESPQSHFLYSWQQRDSV
jgi:hypothetical protein